MTTSVKSSSINFGLYLGATLSIATILAYAFNLNLFINFTFGILLFIITIILGIVAAYKAKQIQHGFITFKETFTAYFITVLIGVAISTLISFVIFNIIDPEAAVQLKEMGLNAQVEMLRNFNSPEEKIVELVEASEKQGDLFSIQNVLQSLVGYIIFYSLIGLLIALIIKRNPENA